ncbi:hypothetical protein C8R45DRAFT_1020855, partial [Mycena sanguinolenta]
MAPRLRKLNMTIYSNGRLGHVLIFPWSQLTDVTFDSDSPDVILSILVQCPTLTHASICTADWPLSATAPLASMVIACPLVHLRTLSFVFGLPEHGMRFLGSLSAPALKTLRLDFLRMRFGMQSKVSLPAFLMHSPDITQLEIRGSRSLTSHELIATLQHTTRLTHLELGYVDRHCVDDALIDALSYHDGVAPLVPHLQELVLREIEEDGFTPQNLERMLVSRWSADMELTPQSVLPAVARWTRVELWGQYSEDLAGRVQMLQVKGLPLI